MIRTLKHKVHIVLTGKDLIIVSKQTSTISDLKRFFAGKLDVSTKNIKLTVGYKNTKRWELPEDGLLWETRIKMDEIIFVEMISASRVKLPGIEFGTSRTLSYKNVDSLTFNNHKEVKESLEEKNEIPIKYHRQTSFPKLRRFFTKLLIN